MEGIETASAELRTMMSFLERDRSNLRLLRDAATLAYDEGHRSAATELLERYAAIAPLPAPLINLSALVALASDRIDHASAMFEDLHEAGHDTPELRLNRAWCRALLGDHEAALALLSDEAVTATPLGATLRVRTLHHLGELDEALEAGAAYAGRFPDHAPLFGALAQVALDAEQAQLAARYAESAGDTVEGRSTKGMLLLADGSTDDALTLFEATLAERPDDARALLGQGIALLNAGDQRGALGAMRGCAERFGTHSGSWVAAGWLHLLDQDRAESRTCFDRALAIDGNFAESHGGLAVVDILEGDFASGERRAQTALRLDRESFGGALANILILQAQGDTRNAERLMDAALKAPAGPGGSTIAQALAAMSWAGGSLKRRPDSR